MGGPIVRTGATPKFSDNWDRIFGGTPGRRSASKTTAPGKSKGPAKAAKKASPKKKAAQKPAKKSSKKRR